MEKVTDGVKGESEGRSQCKQGLEGSQNKPCGRFEREDYLQRELKVQDLARGPWACGRSS